MDVKPLIESGTLEAYVLGTATPEEVALVQSMLHHPEVKAELARIEDNLEAIARKFAIDPPPSLRAQVLDAVQREALAHTTKGPVTGAKPWLNSISWIAAAIGLMSTLWFFNLQRRANTALSETQVALQQCKDKTNEMQVMQQQIVLLSDPATKRYQLASLTDVGTRAATVYANPTAKRCLISVAALGNVPAGKSFQLWAIQAGKPVSLGVLDTQAEPNLLRDISCTDAADAYAISLEPEGGSPTPTEVILMSKG